MKHLLTTLLTIITISLNAQVDLNCGTWEIATSDTLEWVIINDYPTIERDSFSWLYRKLEFIPAKEIDDCACGCGHPREYLELRICRKTGVKQRRRIIQYMKYKIREQGEFEKVEERFRNKNN